MNEKAAVIIKFFKKPKVLAIIGIIGIILIALSSFMPQKSKDNTALPAEIDLAEYKKEIQQEVTDIVYSVTGDKKATVVITLESGVRYSYADVSDTDTSVSSSEKNENSSSKKSQSYITVRNSEGGEEALLITQSMPEIRGVAIICRGGGNELIAEKIKNAVQAALDITSTRVYITGGN